MENGNPGCQEKAQNDNRNSKYNEDILIHIDQDKLCKFPRRYRDKSTKKKKKKQVTSRKRDPL